jgi:hypothetical protein
MVSVSHHLYLTVQLYAVIAQICSWLTNRIEGHYGVM